jgi:two-component system chemotaxis response regulator CheY
MPDQEGIGLIMSLRQKHKALKILAISGGGRLSHTDYLQMAERLGANATLAKPFRRDALLAAVQKLLTD